MTENSATEAMLRAFEGHDVSALRAALDAGANAVTPIRGKTPVQWLLGEYTRSDRLKECLYLLGCHGAKLPDPVLFPVLTDDKPALLRMISVRPSIIEHRTSLESAFVSLTGVTLLHVAAEFGCREAVEALIEAGVDVNAQAQFDHQGCNGHTPIFHTVNSNANRSEPVMRMLLKAGARVDVHVDALYWGEGYEWETVFFDVTPVSFAQMGLLPQVHRREADIYANIALLRQAAGKSALNLRNVPNTYLKP